MSFLNKAFGGYFELELPERQNTFLDNALKFNSARSSLSALLVSRNTKKVWLPTYICDSIPDTIRKQGIEIQFYSLTSDFEIASEISLNGQSLLVYVNYFGLCGKQADKVVSRFGGDKVVIDNSQAFYRLPSSNLASFYSPRKFFGLPDGGLLYSTDERVKQPSQRDDTSEQRLGHLISRLAYDPEAAYGKYQEAEKQISQLPTLGMSRLTERLLRSLDVEGAREVRLRNALYLHRYLSDSNQLNFTPDLQNIPMCYPYLPKRSSASRSELISNRIFVPSYWPEVLDRAQNGSFERDLSARGVFLPCDQRYTEAEMGHLVRHLKVA